MIINYFLLFELYHYVRCLCCSEIRKAQKGGRPKEVEVRKTRLTFVDQKLTNHRRSSLDLPSKGCICGEEAN